MALANGVHNKAMLRSNSVLGASDGIVTTFAIIAGSVGASLAPAIVITLGMAKLLADAVSMSSGVYLGLRSEMDFQKAKEETFHTHSLARHSLSTFTSFIVAGIFPLIPYILGLGNALLASVVIVLVELFGVGSLKTLGTKRKWFLGGLEMLVVGGLAAFVAYATGSFLDKLV